MLRGDIKTAVPTSLRELDRYKLVWLIIQSGSSHIIKRIYHIGSIYIYVGGIEI